LSILPGSFSAGLNAIFYKDFRAPCTIPQAEGLPG